MHSKKLIYLRCGIFFIVHIMQLLLFYGKNNKAVMKKKMIVLEKIKTDKNGNYNILC